MDFKTPKMEQVTNNLVAVVSVGVGAIGSNFLVSSLLGNQLKSKDGAVKDATKRANERKLYKGLTCVAGLVGASFVQGNDSTANMLRNALLGASVTQGLSLVREFVIDEKSEIATQELFDGHQGLRGGCTTCLGNPEPEYFYLPQPAETVTVTVEKPKNFVSSFSAENSMFN